MKISQKNAISYAYSKKREKEEFNKAKELKIDLIFKWQSKYKTIRGFVNSAGSKRFDSAIKEAENKILFRRILLSKCNPAQDKIEEVEKAMKQIERIILGEENDTFSK